MRLAAIALVLAALAVAQEREERVRADRAAHRDGAWIYDDLDAGRARARANGKPLLVVLRCIP